MSVQYKYDLRETPTSSLPRLRRSARTCGAISQNHSIRIMVLEESLCTSGPSLPQQRHPEKGVQPYIQGLLEIPMEESQTLSGSPCQHSVYLNIFPSEPMWWFNLGRHLSTTQLLIHSFSVERRKIIERAKVRSERQLNKFFEKGWKENLHDAAAHHQLTNAQLVPEQWQLWKIQISPQALLLGMASYCMQSPFGHSGSVVPSVSPPSFLYTSMFLTGKAAQEAEKSSSTLSKHCSATSDKSISVLSILFSSWIKSIAPFQVLWKKNYSRYYKNNQLYPSQWAMGGQMEPALSCTLKGVGSWDAGMQVGLRRVNVNVKFWLQAVFQWLRLCIHILDDLAWSSQPYPRCKGWPQCGLGHFTIVYDLRDWGHSCPEKRSWPCWGCYSI